MNKIESNTNAEMPNSVSNDSAMDSLKHLEEHHQEKYPQLRKWYQNQAVQMLYSILTFAAISFIIISLLTLFSDNLGRFINSRKIFTARITDNLLFKFANRLRVESELLPPNERLRAIELAQNLDNAAEELEVEKKFVLKSLKQSAASWLQMAIAEYTRQNQLGVYNNRIMQYIASIEPDTTNFLLDNKIAWSSHFVNWIMHKSNMIGNKNQLPTSWLQWGKAEVKPKHGVITVFKLKSSYKQEMVGFFLLETYNYDIVLAGDVLSAINIIAFEKANLLGYRWPIE